MRLVHYDRSGGIDAISIDQVPDPAPAPGEVVVRVAATGINPASVTALHGAPYVPGRDLAGEVVAVSDGVGQHSVGDEVLGWCQDWAAHAELVAVPSEQLVAKPVGLSWDVAGSLHTTAMAGLAGVLAVDPAPGEVVVVSGASGGVGLTACQLAARRGAVVIGLASERNAALLQEHGVIPVTYGEGQEERIRSASAGTSVGGFIDCYGSGYVDPALALGVPAARVNTVVDFQAARAAGVQTLGTRDAGGTSALAHLAELASTGELDVPVACTYPLAQVQDAYRRLVDPTTTGRIVLRPQE